MASAEKIIGIDLGTTRSLVAVTSSGEPKIIFNRDGEPATPSVVSFAEGGEVLVRANALILHDATRSNRQLQPMPGNPTGQIHVVQWSTNQEEAAGIAAFIIDPCMEDEPPAGR